MRRVDPRYTIIKRLVKDGTIRQFHEIFQYIEMDALARHLGKPTPRFKTLIDQVEKFTINEMMTLAPKLGLSFETLMQLVKVQLEERNFFSSLLDQ